MRARRVPTAPRLVIAVVCALFVGHFVRWNAIFLAFPRDLGHVWYAAKVLVGGGDPYRAIGPGRAFDWPWSMYYPLPAAVAVLPLAPLSYPHAMAAFAALGIGVLAWTLMEHGYASLLALTSTCVVHAIYVVQWSPLIAGALVLAPVSAVLIAKPTIGAAVFVARPSWWAVGGAVVLLGISFALQPHWVESWRAAIASASLGPGREFPFSAPMTMPGGALVLLAITRWRRPEARLLVALACVPQTLLPYEGVLLFLIPRGWIQMTALVALSYAMTWGWVHIDYSRVDLSQLIAIYGPAMTMFLYLPATAMIMLRPNEGHAPAWLERVVMRWPVWIRGRPSLP